MYVCVCVCVGSFLFSALANGFLFSEGKRKVRGLAPPRPAVNVRRGAAGSAAAAFLRRINPSLSCPPPLFFFSSARAPGEGRAGESRSPLPVPSGWAPAAAASPAATGEGKRGRNLCVRGVGCPPPPPNPLSPGPAGAAPAGGWTGDAAWERLGSPALPEELEAGGGGGRDPPCASPPRSKMS